MNDRQLRQWCLEMALGTMATFHEGEVLQTAENFYRFVMNMKNTVKDNDIPHVSNINLDEG